MSGSKLIIDVGMHDGSDTAHYLSRGYRVVAIDANPQLCEDARQRFRNEIDAGQLVVLNVGIASEVGDLEFWINLDNSEQSSFDRGMATRFGTNVTPIRIQTVPFRDILAQYGIPFYLKIDIEGLDALCLEDLDPDKLPDFVSVEGHSIENLILLHQKGYRLFKCINQRDHSHPGRPLTAVQRIWSELVGLTRACGTAIDQWTQWVPGRSTISKLSKRITRAIRRRLQPTPPRSQRQLPGVVKMDGQSAWGTSGPFGEETAGQWKSFDVVAYDWLHIKQGFPHRSALRTPGWYDFHAKREPEA